MKKILIKIILILVCSFAIFVKSQAQNWLWAKEGTGASVQYGTCTSTDTSGNVFIGGFFNGTSVTFGTYSLTNVAGYSTFTAKYDANGNVLWAKSGNATGPAQSLLTSICTDLSGNAIVAGYFNNTTLTFSPITLLNYVIGIYDDIFLVKYDSNGNVLWAKNFESYGLSGGNCYANSISTDQIGNIYITGSFATNLIFGNDTLTNTNLYSSNIYIAKFDPNGNYIWSKTVQGSGNDVGNSIKTDSFGNVYVAGSFISKPTLTFGTYTLTNNGVGINKDNAFLAKYDSNGNVLWAKSVGGTNDDLGRSVSTDGTGNSYFGGSFNSPSLTVGTYTLINPNPGVNNSFLVKSDPSGNVLWVRATNSGLSGITIDCISTSTAGNSYAIGHCGYTFSIGTVTVNCPYCSGSPTPIYIAKYDSSGNVICADGLGTGGYGATIGVAIDKFDNAFVTGTYACNPFAVGWLFCELNVSFVKLFRSIQ